MTYDSVIPSSREIGELAGRGQPGQRRPSLGRDSNAEWVKRVNALKTCAPDREPLPKNPQSVHEARLTTSRIQG